MKASFLISIIFLLFLNSYSQNVDYSRLEMKKDYLGNYLLYLKGGTELFTGTAERKWPNGKTENTDQYYKGKRDGKCISYSANGNISSVINYKDGNYGGEMIYYYDNGNIESENNYCNGIRDGKEITYFYSGKICSYSNYKNGKITGTSTYWYENGTKNWEYTYNKGKPEKSFRWDTSGNIINESYYSNDGYGSFVKSYSWYKNGQKKSEAILINGQMDSTFTVWYENSIIKEIIHYKNGQWNGLWTDYDINGNVISQGEYKNDELVKGDQMYLEIIF